MFEFKGYKQFFILIASFTLCFIIYRVVYFAGGTSSPYPHFYYFPIMFAAIFGNWLVSLATAIFSSALMSYWLMDLNVSAHTYQSHFGWLFRAFMFISISVFVKITINALQKNQNLLLKKSRQLTLFRQSALNALLDLAETRDPDSTGRHLERLSSYAELLLEHIDISDEEKQNIILSIPFHDIGKVAIPDYILLKPGKLTAEEFEMMKKHSTIGGEILQSIENSIIDEELDFRRMLQTARELTFYHHERPDGKGYPFGLTGESIPLSARITALCDVYDALSNNRPYKEAFPHETCVNIICEGRGTQFDEQLVDLFLNLESDFKRISEALRDKPIKRVAI